ncbi:MAG TPA: hypothetical protein V6C72_03820, partial [Chroococcales cyanobacterium]
PHLSSSDQLSAVCYEIRKSSLAFDFYLYDFQYFAPDLQRSNGSGAAILDSQKNLANRWQFNPYRLNRRVPSAGSVADSQSCIAKPTN